MLTVLLISATAVAAPIIPPGPITLGNADQYCAFQYGWQLATKNPDGSQQSFEECLRHPPHKTRQEAGVTTDAGEMFPPSACIPSQPDPDCASHK
jgi:hypothetical protein